MSQKTFVIGRTYKTTERIKVCTEEGHDCAFPDMVDVVPNTLLIFDGNDDQTFRFHREDGLEYRLHKNDVIAMVEAQ